MKLVLAQTTNAKRVQQVNSLPKQDSLQTTNAKDYVQQVHILPKVVKRRVAIAKDVDMASTRVRWLSLLALRVLREDIPITQW